MTEQKYEFICDFKDSILVDEETERQQDRVDMQMGIMRPEEYRHYIMRFRHSWQRMQENIGLPQQSEKEITRKQKNYYTS